MKRFSKVTMTTILCMGLTLTGCGSADNTSTTTFGTTTSGTTGQSDSSKTAIGGEEAIYLISLRVGGATWSQTQQGFEGTCRELGRDGYYVAPTTTNNSSQMANLYETAMTSDVDAILGPLFDEDVFTDIIGCAHEQGMLVSTTNTYLGSIEDFSIDTDQENMGVTQAETLIDLVGDNPCRVVWMTTNISNTSIMEIYDAFCQVLEGHDNISIHGVELDGNNPTMAADKMNNLWRADPTINAVVYNDSSGTNLGIPSFIEENNLQNEFYPIGVDASADILNYVMTGGLDCTLDQNFYKIGYESVRMLKDVWDGKEVEKEADSGVNCVTSVDAVEYGASRSYEVTATAK